MEDNSVSKREKALTNILERLAKHVEHYDDRLDVLEQQQQKLSAAVENLVYQIALGQDGAESSVKKLEQDFMRYRSDMFKLASDQSSLVNNMKEMTARQASIFSAQETTVAGIANIEGRFSVQEDAMQEHTKHSIKQGDTFFKELTEIDNHFTKLNLETQKHLMADFKETHQMLENARFEITNRLYAFDEIEDMLKILLARTKPPEPKEPSVIVRAVRQAAGFINVKIRWLFGKGGEEETEETVEEAADSEEAVDTVEAVNSEETADT